MDEQAPDGASPLDRPDWDLEVLLRERGLMHYSTKLAMEGACIAAKEQLIAEIVRAVAESMERGEKPTTAEGCEAWLRKIIEERLAVFDARLIEAGLPPSSGT